jgi:beta-galactosidase
MWAVSCQSSGNGALDLGEHLFDADWKFKNEDVADARQPAFDDSDWRVLTIPHDWGIEPRPIRDGEQIGPFVKGIKDSTSTGNLPGGIGWYRKHFTLHRADAGKTFLLCFDGVSVQSEVWLNGRYLGFHPNGYMPFYYDLTPCLNPEGEDNVIAVKTVHTGDNSRWYPGAGLYRHVWLSVSRSTHILPWGVHVVTPEVTPEQSQVHVSVSVRNDANVASEALVGISLFAPDGRKAGYSEQMVSCPPEQTVVSVQTFSVDRPQLWSPDSPGLYTAEATVANGNEGLDVQRIRFGIRSIRFSSETGFLLNGKSILLKGACVHHDNGLLGAATFDGAEIRRVRLLKENGFNAIRTSHNPPSAQFLDACDSLGMMVIDEAFDMWIHPKRAQDYHLYFEEWAERDLSSMMLRDRNHPSVILWSIGNEIFERADSSGLAIARRLTALVKTLDVTRPVSQAICAFWQDRSQPWDATAPAFALLDVGCYNYEWEQYERDHRLYPERVMIGTESFPKEAWINWRMAVEKPYVTGDFVWTGMDYIGEVGIGNTRYDRPGEKATPERPWPWYLSWCGDLDICGNKKPQSWYRDVVWGRSELEILVHHPVPDGQVEYVSLWGWPDEYPHWNWDGYENVPLQVSVYTVFDTVRLFLNGRKVDEKPVGRSQALTATFSVPYQAGELRAVGIRNGEEVLSGKLTTSGPASRIRLVAEQSSVRSDPNDLAYVRVEITDEAGQRVPDAAVTVRLTAGGNGCLIASGNASPCDLKSFRNPVCTTFGGRALAILQPDDRPGTMSLTATADGFPETKVEIKIQ